jgi:hypothetical protein
MELSVPVDERLIELALYSIGQPIHKSQIELAINNIVKTTLSELNNRCKNPEKSVEFIRIARECASLSGPIKLSSYQDILAKGRSLNSEIFGIELVNIIDQIAEETQLKRKMINTLMAITTPLTLYKVYDSSKSVAENNIVQEFYNYLSQIVSSNINLTAPPILRQAI